MFDYHVHTEQSVDCATPIEASCEAAIRAGVTEIAFTDHIDHEPADLGYGYWDAEAYFASIDRARDRFGDRLTILSGAEVDFNTGIASEVEDFLGRHAFDVVIGSVHYGELGEIIFPPYFATRSLDEVFAPYLEQVQAAVETGWFDMIGHIDLPKRYAPAHAGDYDPMRYERQLRLIFSAMIDLGMSFEINTSGLRQAPKASMPAAQIVALYASMGGERVTTGTDSHVPETVGAGLEQTLAMLELCGITHISSFRQRQRTQVPIASLVATARS